MAMIGPENIARAAAASAAVGVNPPTAIPQFSSMRSTHRLAASKTSSIPPTQSSTVMFRGEGVEVVIGCPFGLLQPAAAFVPAACCQATRVKSCRT